MNVGYIGGFIRGFVVGICAGYVWRMSNEPHEKWNYLAWRERRKVG